MSEQETMALSRAANGANALSAAADEGVVLAITASYLAGKEAGLREREVS